MLRLKSQLSEAMEHLRRSLAKKEQEVTTDSKFHLDELVKKADLTLCGNNCKDWMAIIQKSENALKTVEEKVRREQHCSLSKVFHSIVHRLFKSY